MDKLRLQLEKGDFPLQVRLLAWSRDQNNFSVQIDEADRSSIAIDFDFVDAGDGGIFEVIHQGEESPKVVGTIRGSSLEQWPTSKRISVDFLALGKPWYRRENRAKVLTGLALAIFICAQIPWLFIPMYVRALSHGDLVDQSQYQLTSLDGQLDFAEKVFEVGKVGGSPFEIIFAWAAGPLLLGMLVMVAHVLGAFQRRFPRSIVKNLAQPPSPDVEGLAPQERAPAQAEKSGDL
ncbi:hypothetical protein ACWEGE_22120 [Amycolatopsis sp. NPDC004747]